MNQETKRIVVELKKHEDNDLLAFNIKENEYHVNLNSENSQNELKKVFSVLLEQLTVNTIELELIVAKDYKSALFIDVCTEYIKELNREIKQVIKKIPRKEDNQVKIHSNEEVSKDEMIL